MRKIYLLGLITLLFSSSCADFLDRTDANKIAEPDFFHNETDLELYSNMLLDKLLPGAETLAWGDQYADNIATRSSNSFLIGDTYSSTDQGGWSGGSNGTWSDLRRVNYFLDNMHIAKGAVSDAVLKHYEGVGRFWRAMFYYDMVRTFGDVPWYDHEIDYGDTESLYKGRDSREFVMGKVLEDLTFAATYCSTEARFVKSSTRITRWTALALKSRICLFEGTYRKYHPELGLTASAESFLREAESASADLMENGPYRIYTSGNVNTQYRELFTTEAPNETEIILASKMKNGMRMHEITWKIFSASYGNNWSLTKQFVNTYLMADGTRFTEKEGYDKVLYKDEFKDRDNRLKQTVISPEYKRVRNGVLKPDAPNFTMTSTGYQMIKWALDDDAFEGKANSYNSISVFRYAEVLLNYAEAKAELGEFDESVWNKTIKPLRERAGVKSVIPTSYDPYLAEYFMNQTTDKWILEVRRERGIELAFENLRYDDMMRWKMGELVENTWRGMYVPAKNVPMDLNGDGINDVIVMDPGFVPSDKNAKKVELGSAFRLSEGDHGYIEFGFSQGRLWNDKKYLHPVPKYAIDQNENLLPQNPGWN